jgi:transposase-like protein
VSEINASNLRNTQPLDTSKTASASSLPYHLQLSSQRLKNVTRYHSSLTVLQEQHKYVRKRMSNGFMESARRQKSVDNGDWLGSAQRIVQSN